MPPPRTGAPPPSLRPSPRRLQMQASRMAGRCRSDSAAVRRRAPSRPRPRFPRARTRALGSGRALLPNPRDRPRLNAPPTLGWIETRTVGFEGVPAGAPPSSPVSATPRRSSRWRARRARAVRRRCRNALLAASRVASASEASLMGVRDRRARGCRAAAPRPALAWLGFGASRGAASRNGIRGGDAPPEQISRRWV